MNKLSFISELLLFTVAFFVTGCSKPHIPIPEMTGTWDVYDQRHSHGSDINVPYNYRITIVPSNSEPGIILVTGFGNIPWCIAKIKVENSTRYLYLQTSNAMAHGHLNTFTYTGTPGQVTPESFFFNITYKLNVDGLLFEGFIVADKIGT